MRSLYFFISFMMMTLSVAAQVTITGTVTDKDQEPLIGANVVLKGTTSGTITDFDGNFSLIINEKPPFTIVVSYVGYKNSEIEVKGSVASLKVVLDDESSILDEVVVSASRVEEKILESPVTIEKLDLQMIKGAASADFFDQMTKLKGVTTSSGSMNFNSINTRGFGGVSNVRFVQLVDGVDNSAPLLNFPMGNLIGLTESDTRSIELVPGAASALYGPNAFNGIMLMASKNPWDYAGLNLSAKVGVTHATNDDPHPMYSVDLRYAKAWKKFGFKVTGGYFGATDWLANDYKTDIKTGKYYNKEIKPSNFDGVNTYGDEVQIFVPFTQEVINGLKSSELAQGLADNLFGGDMQKTMAFLDRRMVDLTPVDLRRTGLTEEELLDNRDASSLKAGASLYYRPKDDINISYNFRFGSGNSIYQGDERYALRNFLVYVNKIEATGKDFMVRAYMTQTKAGDSYNLSALGAYANEELALTEEAWAPTYLGNYMGVLMAGSFIKNRPVSRLGSNIFREAHAAGRNGADELLSTQREAAIETVRNRLFQQGGAKFIDDSRLWHAEGTYDFTRLLKDKIGILIGGNYRLYDLFTDGTVFNEDPDGTGVNGRIHIGEYGAFVQATKKFFEDKLRLSASIRYDKNENFEGQFSPRVATVVTLGKQRQHNIRASFQTGFRNPDTQAQFLYFPATNILIGGAKKNAERYGIYEGGAYSLDSYNAFQQSVINGKPDTSLLKVFYMDYISPEKLTSVEVGYKSMIKGLYIDWNAYFNWYRDFIGNSHVVNIEQTYHKGQALPGVNQVLSGEATAPTVFRPSHNIKSKVTSWGTAIGLSYRLKKGYLLKGNYTYMDYKAQSDADSRSVEFNSPKHMFNIGVANMNVNNSNAGFDISYRWQQGFYWSSSFGSGDIQSYGTLDAAFTYQVKNWHTVFKLGGTNLVGPTYRTIIGGPYIGRMIFAGISYDPGEILGKKKKS